MLRRVEHSVAVREAGSHSLCLHKHSSSITYMGITVHITPTIPKMCPSSGSGLKIGSKAPDFC